MNKRINSFLSLILLTFIGALSISSCSKGELETPLTEALQKPVEGNQAIKSQADIFKDEGLTDLVAGPCLNNDCSATVELVEVSGGPLGGLNTSFFLLENGPCTSETDPGACTLISENFNGSSFPLTTFGIGHLYWYTPRVFVQSVPPGSDVCDYTFSFLITVNPAGPLPPGSGIKPVTFKVTKQHDFNPGPCQTAERIRLYCPDLPYPEDLCDAVNG